MFRRFKQIAFLGLVLPVGAALAVQPTGVIQTKSGAVQGVVSQGVEAFLGIPYAAPPIGPRRWRAPLSPRRWNGVRKAFQFGANCYQGAPVAFGPYTSEFLISAKRPMSENCLFLNVWTSGTRGKLKPVYVFFHGGGFDSGSGSIPIYNGANLARRDVVVVTLNYRLGVFGFLALPELTNESRLHSSGNYGLEDQIAALRWVRENIAGFGGDPKLVTISGQSAGAGSVSDLLMSPLAKGLFARAIAESGVSLGFPFETLAKAEAYGAEFERKIGKTSVRELRAMSAQELEKLTAFTPPFPGKPASGWMFRPNVDGSVVAAAPRADAVPVSNVPLLTGFNASEGWPFLTVIKTPAQFESYVRSNYPRYADRLLALYPHATDQEASESGKLLGHDRTMAGMLLFVERRAAAGETVYCYVFDHPYPVPLTAEWGSFHTGEIPYVFGNLTQKGRPFTAGDWAISRQLQSYWVNFMRNGDPNGDDLTHWPRMSASERLVMGLGDHVGARPAVSSAERLLLWQKFFGADRTGL